MTASLTQLETRYREQLDDLRLDGAAFAKAFPQIAGRLGIDPFGCSDPHVERLIESVAWLTARQSLDLDHRLPQLAQAILDRLYPQLTAPLPSLAIAAFDCDPGQAEASAGLTVPRGSELLTDHDGHTLRFRTSSDLQLWPVETGIVELRPSSSVPAFDGFGDVACALAISLNCVGKAKFEALHPKSWRLYLNATKGTASSLFDCLSAHTTRIALVDGEGRIQRLPKSALSPAGLDDHDALLSRPGSALDAFRLLLERAALPEKFYFFDLDLENLPQLGRGQSLTLFVGLGAQPSRKLSLDRDAVRLGAVPVVNLFSRISEPLRIDHTKTFYRLEPDARDPRACEVHSIREVWCRRQDASASDRVPPLFMSDDDMPDSGCFWQARRVPAIAQGHVGSDVTIRFCDAALDPTKPASNVLFARLECTNRGLAEALPGGSALTIEQALPIRRVGLLTRPTRQRPARTGPDAIWPLLSQLSLNHLSLVDDPATLKECLALWGADRAIDAIVRIDVAPTVRRLPGQRHIALVHGIEIAIGIDRDTLSRTEASTWLLGSILSRFIERYVAANSFAALSLFDVHSQDRIASWPARAGNLALI